MMQQPPPQMGWAPQPPPAPKNNIVKPLLIGCGGLLLLLLIVGGVGSYFAMRAVGSAIHNSAAGQMAESVAQSAQQAEAQAGASPDPEHAAAAGVAVLKSMVGGGKAHVETLSREEIKSYLPSSVGSFAKTGSESRSGGYAGISGTSASATYGTGEQTISIVITDAANMSGLTTILGFAMGIESEDDNGYEKSVTLGDTKVHEKWTSAGKSSELIGIVGDRFFVDVEGSGVDMSAAEQAFQAVNIAKLESVAAATPSK